MIKRLLALFFLISNLHGLSANSFLNAVTTAQGSFSYTVHKSDSRVGNNIGTFYFNKAGMLNWLSRSEHIPSLLIQQKKIYIIDAELDQVTVVKRLNISDKTPFQFLFNSGHDIARTYAITRRKVGHRWQVKLLAHHNNETYQEINLLFSQDPSLASIWPISMKITDSFGYKTVIKFTGVLINQPLPKDIFVFKLPEGFDLVEES